MIGDLGRKGGGAKAIADHTETIRRARPESPKPRVGGARATGEGYQLGLIQLFHKWGSWMGAPEN